MRFKAFDICELIDNDAKRLKLKDDLFYRLNTFPRINEGSDSYAPLYMTETTDYIYGTLVQSYIGNLTTFDQNSDKDEIAIDADSINDKTYFYIDKLASILYIQGKLYPSTLNASLTRERLSKILNQCTKKSIILVPTLIEYTIDEIYEIFTSSQVKKVIFKNMLGLTVPEGSVLHNPRKHLDESLAETWNTYSSPVLDYMELRAKSEERLNKNPLAKLGMILSKENRSKNVFQSMDVYDSGEKVSIKPKGNENKIIYISKRTQDDPYETYEKIKKKIDRDYIE